MEYISARNGKPKTFDRDLALALIAYLRTCSEKSKGDFNGDLLKFRWKGEPLLVNQLAPIFVTGCLYGPKGAADIFEDFINNLPDER